MKTRITTPEINRGTLRPVAGKPFAFLRTPAGDAFVPPPVLRRLAELGLPAWAVVESGPRGIAVAEVLRAPRTEAVPEPADVAAVVAAAQAGTLFSVDCDAPGPAGDIRRAWHAMRADPKHRAAAEEAQKIANAVRAKAQWAGLDAAGVAAKICAEAAAEQGGVDHLAHWLRKAERAGADVSGCDSIRAEIAEAEEIGARAEAERRQRAEAREAKVAPHRERAAVLVAALPSLDRQELAGRYGAGVAEAVAERLADGAGDEIAAEMAAQAKAARDSGPHVPDSWGYAHGTDFDGGSW